MSGKDSRGTRPLRLVDQRTMLRIFAVTDELGVSREALRVQLLCEGAGRVRALEDGIWEIVVPEEGDLAPFLQLLARTLVERS
jgi:hypothetical protein